MKRLLAATALLLTPGLAQAGVGTSYGLGGFSLFGSANTWYLPSVDVRSPTMHLQIRALDTLANLANEDIYLAGSYWMPMVAQDLGNGSVVVQPGGTAILANQVDWGIGLLGGARVGAEWEDQAGIGVYVVPQLGIAYDDPNVDVIFSGAVEISVWLDS